MNNITTLRGAHETNNITPLAAALEHAADGWLVFPVYWLEHDGSCACFKGPRCDRAGKHPVYDKKLGLEHGFHDATKDPERVRELWAAYPQANIGGRTSPVSGRLVVDEDPRNGGTETREALVAEHGPQGFETRTHATGGDGRHRVYRYPEGEKIRCDNKGEKLGPGLDVKAEGGYVLLPGSSTTGPYTVLDPTLEAELPQWMLGLLREPHEASGKHAGEKTVPVSVSLDGPPIPERKRNDTLTSIAGRLHDGTRTLEQLYADLAAVNEARCVTADGKHSNPLPADEVRDIATSIHEREPSKVSVDVTPEVVAALDVIEEEVWERAERWRGKAGLSQWKIKYALIDAAREHGTLIPGGVRIGLSVRDLAERAGVAKSTVQKNVPEMKKAGEIRADNLYRRTEEAGAFVLPIPARANPVHSPTATELLRTTGLTSVPDLRALKKLRHGAPRVWRLGPRAGMATLALLRSGGTLSPEELAERLGVSRVRDLHRKGGVLERMEWVGVVERSDTDISLTQEWHDALQYARGVGREEQAERFQELLHRTERERYNQTRKAAKLTEE